MNYIECNFLLRKGEFLLDINTKIPAKGITGILGASGSGKTTLLRCLAGLEKLQHDDVCPPNKRDIGYVFQDLQLFPHLTVQKNLEYGWRRNPNTKKSIIELSEILEVDHLFDRSINELSGGEAQRVCIARALCQDPKLILMDEPLSSLDIRCRKIFLPYLDRLNKETSIPIIYVSHNIDEICQLSDHIIVLDKGNVIAEGDLQDTLSRVDIPLLNSQHAGAVIEARKLKYDSNFDLSLFEFSGGELWVPGSYDILTGRFRIRASDVSLSRAPIESSTILNSLPSIIEEIVTETNATHLVRLRLGSSYLIARITRRSLHELRLKAGDKVFAQIKSVTVSC
ncbi:MAG: molybdenum ABC transporter ATP-binding protein [Gammaproteobacteria bacterium]|nr:molybdenum ABC transporter ATP-binding protein [Gammaproteobacteria bacterium]|tara:strand:+ start:11697 stop:12716 length:1020 start_codon:yes stop_codon:yes gene_type:complete